jgi:glycosyltransferase involved in cell wall biosynthesis
VSRLRVAIVAAARFPIAEPFAGGLEAHVWTLAKELRRRGHAVTVFAGPGSDPLLGVETLALRRPRISAAARADVSMGPADWLDEHHAYLGLMLRLGRDGGSYDVVHNHSLHHLPIAMAATLDVPMVSTLHTPPTPWLESAIQVRDDADGLTFVAVSDHTARGWRHLVPDARVIHNGVDMSRWKRGRGGGPLLWHGRVAPEKGTHLAIDAALRAGERLVVAGPITDRQYYEAEVRPRLASSSLVEHVGHLRHRELAVLIGDARAVLVTPCWDEPYGLVVAEAMACGTPVCAFARGALPELIDESCGVLVEPGDVVALAAATKSARSLSRAAVRRHAEAVCSLDAMVERYEDLYRELTFAPVG